MFSNCGNSFCQFFKKLFRINERKIGSYNIITSKSSVINSNDLNKYLFADECESCKNRSKNRNKNKNKNIKSRESSITLNDDDLGVYEPPEPVIMASCDSFHSVDSADDTNSDIESDEEPIKINLSKYNKKRGVKFDIDIL